MGAKSQQKEGLLGQPFARMSIKQKHVYYAVDRFLPHDTTFTVELIVKKTGLLVNATRDTLACDPDDGTPYYGHEREVATKTAFIPWDFMFGFPDHSEPPCDDSMGWTLKGIWQSGYMCVRGPDEGKWKVQ